MRDRFTLFVSEVSLKHYQEAHYEVKPRLLARSFREDSAMPAQKPSHCSHRKRLGKNVASLRAHRNLTQGKLAEKVGVSVRYIQSVEAGEYFPSLPTLVRLRATLRCDWNDIFEGCDKV